MYWVLGAWITNWTHCFRTKAKKKSNRGRKREGVKMNRSSPRRGFSLFFSWVSRDENICSLSRRSWCTTTDCSSLSSFIPTTQCDFCVSLTDTIVSPCETWKLLSFLNHLLVLFFWEEPEKFAQKVMNERHTRRYTTGWTSHWFSNTSSWSSLCVLET